MTVTEAAEELEVKPNTLRFYERRGWIASRLYIGRQPFYTKEAVAEAVRMKVCRMNRKSSE
ncbi:MAG: MerR family transcriptional regulator [Planctomycetota bacterium]